MFIAQPRKILCRLSNEGRFVFFTLWRGTGANQGASLSISSLSAELGELLPGTFSVLAKVTMPEMEMYTPG